MCRLPPHSLLNGKHPMDEICARLGVSNERLHQLLPAGEVVILHR